MHSQAFARRSAFSARGRYLLMSVGSRESIESDDDGETSSVSAFSTQSTKSYKSYKAWRRAQRQRRKNLKRAQTMNDVLKESVEALDLQQTYRFDAEKMERTKTIENGDKPLASVDEDRDELGEGNASNVLPAIAQSPEEPYFSSSPLTSSSEDEDGPSSPSKSKTHCEQLEISGGGNQRIRQIFFKGKDPLASKSYPFTLPAEPSQGENYSTAAVDEPKVTDERRSNVEDCRGLNAISSLGLTKKRSLLELSTEKAKSLNMDANPNEDVATSEKDVLYTETQGFTVSVPRTSPTVSKHIDSWELPPKRELVVINDREDSREQSETSYTHKSSTYVKDDNEPYNDDATRKPEVFYTETHGFTFSLPTTSPTVPAHILPCEYPSIYDKDSLDHKKDEGTQDAGQGANELRICDTQGWKSAQSFEKGPQNQKYTNQVSRRHGELENDPGMYFLPPLIAKATKGVESDDNRKVMVQVHQESNADISNISRDTISSSSTLGDTISIDENVYMENTDELLRDLEEREFLGNATRAIPESDTSSIATRESIDPIEDILTREDDANADKRTFSSNGRATIVTPRKEIIREDSAKTSSPSNEENIIQPLIDIPTILVEGKMVAELEEPTLKRVHSHKVGKSKNCPTCKKKEEDKEKATEAEVENEKISMKEASEQETATVPSRPPVFSHMVGEDSKCEVCSPNGEISDASPDLCCTIL